MFAATILLCLTAAGAAEPECGLIADRRGPFRSEEQCRARLGEMGDRVKAMLAEQGFRGTSRMKLSCAALTIEVQAQ